MDALTWSTIQKGTNSDLSRLRSKNKLKKSLRRRSSLSKCFAPDLREIVVNSLPEKAMQCYRCFHDIDESIGVRNYTRTGLGYRHLGACPTFRANMNHCDWCDKYGCFGYELFWVTPYLLCQNDALKWKYACEGTHETAS